MRYQHLCRLCTLLVQNPRSTRNWSMTWSFRLTFFLWSALQTDLTAESGSFWNAAASDCVLSVTERLASNMATRNVIRTYKCRTANTRFRLSEPLTPLRGTQFVKHCVKPTIRTGYHVDKLCLTFRRYLIRVSSVAMADVKRRPALYPCERKKVTIARFINCPSLKGHRHWRLTNLLVPISVLSQIILRTISACISNSCPWFCTACTPIWLKSTNWFPHCALFHRALWCLLFWIQIFLSTFQTFYLSNVQIFPINTLQLFPSVSSIYSLQYLPNIVPQYPPNIPPHYASKIPLRTFQISPFSTHHVFPLGKYQLRPAVKKLYQLRPELSTPNMTSCVPRLVRNCISCIERDGCTKRPTIGRFLHSFIVLYFLHSDMHTYRIVEWYLQHSCYIMLRSNV